MVRRQVAVAVAAHVRRLAAARCGLEVVAAAGARVQQARITRALYACDAALVRLVREAAAGRDRHGDRVRVGEAIDAGDVVGYVPDDDLGLDVGGRTRCVVAADRSRGIGRGRERG